MSQQRKADLLLLMVTAFWGASYYLSDLCLETLMPLALTAWRFISGGLLLAVVFCKHLRHISRATLKYAFFIGLALTGTYIFYGYGLRLTSISNSAFICALPVVFTPLLGWLLYRKPLGKRLSLCLILCVIGLAMLTLQDDLHIAVGDLICMGTPLCYAIDLLLTERAVQRDDVDPIALSVVELGVVAVLATILSLLLEKPSLPHGLVTWGSVLFLDFACTGIAFVIQSVEQQHTAANHVGLIFTMEPVFATIVAFFLAHERLTLRGYIGAAIMLGSLLLMEAGDTKKEKA